MTERTFAIIKPDRHRARHAAGFWRRWKRRFRDSRPAPDTSHARQEAEGFYAVLARRSFFGSLTEFMSSGPCIVMALEAQDAIQKMAHAHGGD